MTRRRDLGKVMTRSPIFRDEWRRNVKRFRGGLVFKAHGLLYHATLDSRVTKKMGQDQ